MFVVLVTPVGLLQQGSPLLFPINNRHLVHYYMLTLLFLCWHRFTAINYLVMGRVCITVNLLIDQNNILSAISRMAISVVGWRAEGPSGFSTPRLGGGGVLAGYCFCFPLPEIRRCRRRRRWLYQVVCSRSRWRSTVVGCR